MKILIIGGHLSPALSVIENLQNDEVFYVGRKFALEGDKALSLEYQTITNLNIPFFELKTARFQRKFTKHTLTSFTKFPIGFFQSIRILKKVKPDVVLGFGGYVSVPLIIASYFLKIPVVIHEQTLEAGLANKMISSLAKVICISFESSRKFFPKDRTILTGLPLRNEILKSKKTNKKNKLPSLYITGGSLGSHAINLLVFQTLPSLLENFSIVHQTGDSKHFMDFDNLQKIKDGLSQEKSSKYIIKKFLDSSEVLKAIQNADIVVSRSGINTVCELIYLEKPSFLIPLHFAQRNEQFKNALFAKQLGIAEIGDEKLLTASDFLIQLNEMFKNIKSYQIKTSENVINSDASLKIIKVLKDVTSKKKI